MSSGLLAPIPVGLGLQSDRRGGLWGLSRYLGQAGIFGGAFPATPNHHKEKNPHHDDIMYIEQNIVAKSSLCVNNMYILSMMT